MLAFIGDPHGRFDEIVRFGRTQQPAALVLLGDQTPEAGALAWVCEALEPTTQVRYILGNHDTDTAPGEPGGPNPVYPYLERHLAELGPERDLNARVESLGGVRVAGLGGVSRGKVWHPDRAPAHHSRAACAEATPGHTRFRGGPPAKQWSSIFPADYEHLAEQTADVLVTHEAPESHPNGFSILGDLARSMGVSLAVHGHHHQPYRTTLAGGVTVVGLGYGANPDGRLTVSGASVSFG